MHAISQEEIFRLAAGWVDDHSLKPRPADGELGPDESLGEYIDSLGFVELIHFLERTTDAEFDVSKLDSDQFTVRGVCACLTWSRPAGEESASASAPPSARA